MPTPRKRNPLSKLSVLSDEQSDAVFAFGEGHTLEVTCKHLADEYDIEISKDGLSKWLNRERGERNFEAQLARISVADKRAGQISGLAGKAAKLNEGNVLLLSAGLQSAILAEDDAGVAEAVKNVSTLVNSLAGEHRAVTARKAVEESREQREIDSCEKFIEWMNNAKAREIVEANIPNADKIAALRKTFFADVDALQASGKVVLPE